MGTGRMGRVGGWALALVVAAAGAASAAEPAATPATPSAPAAAPTPVPINVSYQPAVYWALPFYIASQKGWWAEAGLNPTFSTFPAGAPQVASLAAKAWDVGGTGSAPAVLGAARFDLETIGITNDESAANVLMARPKEADAILKDPASLKGKQLLVSTNSTGEYAALACLAKWGLKRDDMQAVNLAQAQIMSAFVSGNGTLAALWAPNDYTMSEKGDARTVCSGKDAGAVVPGALVARKDFAKDHPELVARFLAVYLHAIVWEKANRAETISLMRIFYKDSGVIIADSSLATEIDTRPTFPLDEQLKLLDRSKDGMSTVDGWFGKLAAYLVSTGTIQAPPIASSFITDTHMKWVAGDPTLKAFAEGK